MFLFSDESGKVISRIESNQTFWDKYGDIVIVSCTVLFLILLFTFMYFNGKRREAKKERMVERDGEEVDSAKLVYVTLIGHDEIELMKGELFIAPIVERENYDFAGWYYDTAFSKPYLNTKIRCDLTLYPKWIKSS